MDDEEETRARFIEQLLDEVTAGYEKIVTPEVLEAMRACLRLELMFHPDGRARVTRAMAEPVVESSGAVPRKAEAREVAPTRKRKSR